LLEPQRTNLCLWSEQINNAGWTKGNAPTITTNIATAPDGYSGADGIQSADGTNYKTITQNFSVSANSTLTLSFFVKKETSETAFGGFTMYFQGGTDKIVYGIVNAVTGTVTYASSTLTATTKVEDYGNYWRIASTATDNGSNTTCAIGYYGTLSANGTSLNTGAGSVRTVWGFQAEVGAYATSYIPTLGTSVTRVADTYQKAGFGNTSTAGTLYYELDNYQPSNPANGQYIVQLFAGSSVGDAIFSDANSISLLNNLAIEGRNNGFSTTLFSFAPTAGATVKIALRYDGTNVVAFVNGVKGTVFADTSVGVKNAIRVNNGENGTQATKQLLFFPTALSDTQCVELTTL